MEGRRRTRIEDKGAGSGSRFAGSLMVAVAIPFAALVAAWSGSDDRAELQSRANVHALAKEMSLVAQGRLPPDRINQDRRPFGPFGSGGAARNVAVSGHVEDGLLELEVGQLRQSECVHLGRLLKGGVNVDGPIEAASVNGSGFMAGDGFMPDACKADVIARGMGGQGSPRNVVRLRFVGRGES